MITEKHNFSVRFVTKTEVELLEDVMYESVTDQPFEGVGFKTKVARAKYMSANKLTEQKWPELQLY